MTVNFKWGLFISLLLGALIFIFYFDIALLDPSNTEWLLQSEGDRSQGFLGSYAFRNDVWHFPITKTVLINYPEGVSIVYTDSNPFMSIIAKLFKPFFKPEYQFWGIWIFLCWIMQSLFAYLVVHRLTKDTVYALLSGFVICLLPTLYNRLGHFNLLAHWVILAAIYLFISDSITDRKKDVLFWTLFIFTSMIHAYLLFMVLSIGSVWFIKRLFFLKNKKNTMFFLVANLIGSVAFLLSVWVLGYFYNKPINKGLLGFGDFSMNLNAFINPVFERYSNFLNPLEFYSDFQQEGYQYLGLGLLALVIFFTFNYILKESLYKKKLYVFILVVLGAFALFLKQRTETLGWADYFYLILLGLILTIIIDSCVKFYKSTLLWLILPALACLVVALSNKITLGQNILLNFEIYEGTSYAPLFQVVRSSGRFFWLSNFVFLAIVLSYTYRSFSNKKIAQLFLFGICLLQVADVYSFKPLIGVENQTRNTSDSTFNYLISKSDEVKFIDCFNTEVAREAIIQKKLLNSFYMAHGSGELTALRHKKEIASLRANKIDANALLVFSNFGNLPINMATELFQAPNNLFVKSKYAKLLPSLQKKTITVYNDSISLKDFCQRIQEHEIVITTISDDAKASLNEKFTTYLDSIYHTQFSKIKYRQSHITFFKEGKLLHESIGTSQAVEYRYSDDNYEIALKSAGLMQGCISSIIINGIDYSTNKRGFNCVSIDKKGFVHIYHFDTSTFSYTF